MTKPYEIPWWNTTLGKDEIESISEAINHRHINCGPRCKKLEDQLASQLEVPFVVSTTSGSVALLLSLLAADIKPGDEVILPAFGFIAPANAIRLLGAIPRFIDVRKDRPLIDAQILKKAVTAKTKAIIAIHLNGATCEIETIKEIAQTNNIRVVEDTAQAFGSNNNNSPLGTQGDLGAFSMGITKMITSGEGGFVATKDEKLYEKLIHLRNHGVEQIAENQFHHFGFNFRLTDIQASIALSQMQQFEEKINSAKRNYTFYRNALEKIKGIQVLPIAIEKGEVPLWTEVLADNRDSIIDKLKANGIQARPFHPCLADSKHMEPIDDDFPNSQFFAKHGIVLPSGPGQSKTDLQRVVDMLKS